MGKARGNPARSAGGRQFDAMASRQPAADGGDRLTGPVGRRPLVDDQCIERPDEEVVGAPPGHLAQQIRIDACADHGRCPNRELRLTMLRLRAAVALGQVALTDVLVLDRMLTRNVPASSIAAPANFEQDFARKVLFFGCSASSRSARSSTSPLAIPERAIRTAAIRSSGVGRRLSDPTRS